MTIHDDNVLDELAYLRAEVRRLRARLDQRTPGLAVLLRRRGFTIYKKEPADDLLLPSKKFLDGYYRMLHKYSFRLFLRDVIKHRTSFSLEHVTRYATPSVTKEYLDYLLSVRLVKKRPKATPSPRGRSRASARHSNGMSPRYSGGSSTPNRCGASSSNGRRSAETTM